jgi:hypothetical protein
MSFASCYHKARDYKSNTGLITSYNYMIEKLVLGTEGVKIKDVKSQRWYTSYDADLVKAKIKSLREIVLNLKARG